MRMALVAHGRFHAFDVARELIARGHDVTLFTNYPGWAAQRFGVPSDRVRSLLTHGVASRLTAKLSAQTIAGRREVWLHEWFGRWACRELARQSWDVIHIWSGVAEETLRGPTGSAETLLMRGSAHIRSQDRLLCEEEQRTGTRQTRPSSWMIAREEREYELADAIVVLSTFAWSTFTTHGVPPDKLLLLPLGAQVKSFYPPRSVVDARRQRIVSGAPLRVLYVGTLAFQKGLWDLAVVARQLHTEPFQFHCVGSISREAASVVADLAGQVTVHPKVPQANLPAMYAWADVFLFPTIQDGYAIVLAQAAASALPIIATTNCAGPDLVIEGETGWVVPIRSQERIVDRLRWCADHRAELATMVEHIYVDFRSRDWADVAADLEALCSAPTA
jgi:glycosyltransferase involved in cell wall biosynthesis